MKFFKLIFLLILLVGCSEPKKEEQVEQSQSKSKIDYRSSDTIKISSTLYQSKNTEEEYIGSHKPLDFAVYSDSTQPDTFVIIDTVCAISIIPDTSWINQQQKEIPDDWNEIVSDNQYYESLALDTLKKVGIKTLYHDRDMRIIKFVKNDSTELIIDLNKMMDAWGIIIFNRTDMPVLWHSTDIDRELKEIYKK